MAKTVCSSKPLNLDYLFISSLFQDFLPAAQIEIVESVEQKMQNTKSNCRAFAISNHLFEQLEIENPGKFIRLQQSVSLNNYVFIGHPDIAQTELSKMKGFLLSTETQTLLKPVLQLFCHQSRISKQQCERLSCTILEATATLLATITKGDGNSLARLYFPLH